MSFTAGPEAYDRFMGRYSRPLASRFADVASVRSGQRALDVGCGPGALTAELVSRVGAASVAAVDPTPAFVEAAGERNPGVEVHPAAAERLPFDDGAFDVALAQLVVHFMDDAVNGLREMRRVTREGGTVAACVWDYTEGLGPLACFWEAACELDPGADSGLRLAGGRSGDLERLFHEAGMDDVQEHRLTVEVEHPSFDEWWEPFTYGVARAGGYVRSLEPARLDALRERCRVLLPPAPFVVSASAWAARGTA